MPLLRGTTLRMRLVERKRPGVARTCRLFSQFARGLGALHAAGLVHRDVQPSNLFVGSERVGRARGIVLDLGRTLHREHGSASTGSHLAGVLPYLAPEQLLGGAVDARTDLVSLGLCLYETLTGTPARA